MDAQVVHHHDAVNYLQQGLVCHWLVGLRQRSPQQQAVVTMASLDFRLERERGAETKVNDEGFLFYVNQLLRTIRKKYFNPTESRQDSLHKSGSSLDSDVTQQHQHEAHSPRGGLTAASWEMHRETPCDAGGSDSLSSSVLCSTASVRTFTFSGCVRGRLGVMRLTAAVLRKRLARPRVGELNQVGLARAPPIAAAPKGLCR